MRSFAAAALVVALVGAPASGLAASQSRYTPTDPSAATLAGSAVVTECRSGDPWIDYRVRLTDPAGATTSVDAVLVIEQGGRSATIPLGALTDGQATGRVPWSSVPGADADASASAVIRVVPSTAAPLRLPVAAPDCDAPSGVSALALTGVSGWAPMLGVLGAAIVAAGVFLRIRGRRRAE